jgi:fumarate hydratase subunit alpha
VELLCQTVKNMALDAAVRLDADTQSALRKMRDEETSLTGKEILNVLIENYELAERENRPLCQDTGLCVIFLEVGQDVHFVNGDYASAIQQGVREAYREGRLRASILNDPLLRRNTGDNTPAIIHVELVPGERVRILFAAKGGGCENSSGLTMLKPAQGREGVVEFVTQTVKKASGNPCPPLVIGVGLGGNMEHAAFLAKKALLRPLGRPNPQAHLAELENAILTAANRTGVGPMGLGGIRTALAAHVEAAPCHIASLPVAVNFDCHSHRHREVIL